MDLRHTGSRLAEELLALYGDLGRFEVDVMDGELAQAVADALTKQGWQARLTGNGTRLEVARRSDDLSCSA